MAVANSDDQCLEASVHGTDTSRSITPSLGADDYTEKLALLGSPDVL